MAEDEVKKILDRLQIVSEALINRDPKPIYSIYALDDPRFTAFEDLPLYTRLDGKAFKEFLETIAKASEVQIEKYDMRVDLLGNVAVITGYEKWRLTLKGETGEGRARFTIVMERRDSDWLVIHEHFTKMPED